MNRCIIDTNPSVRLAAAGNTSTSLQGLARAINDENPDVRLAANENLDKRRQAKSIANDCMISWRQLLEKKSGTTIHGNTPDRP